MKRFRYVLFVISVALLAASCNPNPLRFKRTGFELIKMTYSNGDTLIYRAYENLYYVNKVEDSTYQKLNIYIPDSLVETEESRMPVFVKTYMGGFQASSAYRPSSEDVTGRALKEGYVVVIPGNRGINSMAISPEGKTICTGKAPAPILDLKAVVRYLHYNDNRIPGNSEKIFVDGTSAGGALAALLGAGGNHPIYNSYLNEMGAAPGDEHIFGSICFCPIIDLEHADMAYEWLYRRTNTKSRRLNKTQRSVSEELANNYPDYLNRLELMKSDGTLLTDRNYEEYLSSFLDTSAQKAYEKGFVFAKEMGVKTPVPGKSGAVKVNLNDYLNYIAKEVPLKSPPAFDSKDLFSPRPTPENLLFGYEDGSSVNFTNYSLRWTTNNPAATIDLDMRVRIFLMNPMNFVADERSRVAPHWYIRHGALDRDTAFQIPINLYTLLMNLGYDVNFALEWDTPHTGDYNLDELFEWMNAL